MRELRLDMQVFTTEIRDEEKRTKNTRQREQHEQRPGIMKVDGVFKDRAASSVAGFGGKGDGCQWQRAELSFSILSFLHLTPTASIQIIFIASWKVLEGF